MHLNFIWLLFGMAAAATINSLALTSDYLGIVLPEISIALAVVILLIGTRTRGPEFLRAMVIPVGLGLFHLLNQPLPGMAAMPLFFGIWFGLANRLLAQPVTVPAVIGQCAAVISTGVLFWHHLGGFPVWTLSGLAAYAALSSRSKERRLLP